MLVGYEYNSYKLGVALGVHWTPGPTAPPHWLVVGPSGTGKTVFSGQLAARMVLRENARLWVANYKDDDFSSSSKVNGRDGITDSGTRSTAYGIFIPSWRTGWVGTRTALCVCCGWTSWQLW